MASTPNYEGPKKAGSLIMSNSSGTSLSSAVITGGSNGSRIRTIRIHTGPTTPPGASVVLAVVRSDGTNDVIMDGLTLVNQVDTPQAIIAYDEFYLSTTGHFLKFQLRTALASGSTLHIAVDACDY